MRGDGSGRLVLGVYDGGHIGPGFLNYFGFMTNMVSLGEKFLFYSLADLLVDVEPPDQPTARALSMHQGRQSLHERSPVQPTGRTLSMHHGRWSLQASRTNRRLLWRCDVININEQ
ncbi:hypothetical protein TNCV_4880411 [Trichonephila clavipes]|nr:hypothetical protein TNCV_4880411 [Trichonephila clavipes]